MKRKIKAPDGLLWNKNVCSSLSFHSTSPEEENLWLEIDFFVTLSFYKLRYRSKEQNEIRINNGT